MELIDEAPNPQNPLRKSISIGGFFDVLKNILTCAAIIIGGIWWLIEFEIYRPTKPKLNISQDVSSVRLPGGQTWVNIQINFENVGKKRVVLKDGFTRIQQILPVYKNIAEVFKANSKALAHPYVKPWVVICKRRIQRQQFLWLEAKESAKITQEFFVPGHVKIIRIYSYFKNEVEEGEKRYRLGWSHTITHPIEKAKDIQNGADSTTVRSKRICNVDSSDPNSSG